MRRHHLLAVAMVLVSPAVGAQVLSIQATAAAADAGHPEGISSGQSKLGQVYVDSRGMTLYAMSRRSANFRAQGADALKFCSGPCAQTWIAVTAPAGAKVAEAWTVIEGALGPQWAYKGDPVFTYAGDKAPGSVAGEAAGEDMWRPLAYVPPLPKIQAPANVAALYVDGAYILADGQGHALYTGGKAGSCSGACDWVLPLGAGMASQSIGDWTVSRDGDIAQWAFHGKPVYVSQESVTTKVPAEGAFLRP